MAGGQPHAEILEVSQKAPQYLERTSSLFTPLVSAFVSLESSELLISYEQLFLSCLHAGDDKSAHLCLERLIGRFGSSNERVMGLRGVYQEAIANGVGTLEKLLSEYEGTLSENPTNMVSCWILKSMPIA